MNPAFPRNLPRPPQPVDPSNPMWQAAAWQWVFDTLGHLDTCVDETRDQARETRIELAAFTQAAMAKESSLDERLMKHFHEHEMLDGVAEAKRSVWSSQASTIERVIQLCSTGIVMAIILALLKVL